MKEQETFADIIAEMRERTNINGGDMVDNFSLDATFGEYGGYDPLPLINAYADRLEAAHNREVKNAIDYGALVEASRTRNQVGNAAKLREAAEKVVEIAKREWDHFRETQAMFEMKEICTAALAAPARNCDVGTVEEQSKRLHDYCKVHQCLYDASGKGDECKFFKHGFKEDCKITWANAPYESEDKK